ncbi:MAG: DUF3078 domain-containing protein [Bacteroidales bacterium]
MKYIFYSIVILFSLLSTNAEASTLVVVDSVSTEMESNLIKLIDTSTITKPIDSLSIQRKDTIEEHLIYNRLLMPLQFSGAYPEEVTHINYNSIFAETQPKFDALTIDRDTTFDTYFALDSIRLKIHHAIIFHNPEWVESLLSEIHDDVVTKQSNGLETLQNFFTTEFTLPARTLPKSVLRRINERGYWITGNKAAIQFSQTYISSNWQQGGESNLSTNSTLNMKANYIDPKGWAFYNELDWRASFFTTQSDTVRSWRVNDDLFRISSNLALKAVEKWNYSISTEFKTRLFNSFKTNTNTKLGSFLSPTEFSFGLGMSYEDNFEKIRIKNFSLLLSPYSLNWKYVLSDKVDVTRFGIDAGSKSLSQIGSRLDLRLSWEIQPNINWATRFYYFTTYENVETEWENTFNFVINRYFSTRIFFHLKFDDKRSLPVGETSYFQFKELLSFGLNYSWK